MAKPLTQKLQKILSFAASTRQCLNLTKVSSSLYNEIQKITQLQKRKHPWAKYEFRQKRNLEKTWREWNFETCKQLKMKEYFWQSLKLLCDQPLPASNLIVINITFRLLLFRWFIWSRLSQWNIASSIKMQQYEERLHWLHVESYKISNTIDSHGLWH